MLLIRFFCNFSLRAAWGGLFTAFPPSVDFFKVSFFSSFRTEKALHQDGLWCKASKFSAMFLCLFLMFSLVLRMARIFWFLQRGLSKKCQRGVLKNNFFIRLRKQNLASIHFCIRIMALSGFICVPLSKVYRLYWTVLSICYQSKTLVISWYRLMTR